jgi:hypothetical protein
MNPRATFVLATLCIGSAAFAQSGPTTPTPLPPPRPKPPTAHDGLSPVERDCMQLRDQGARARCLERAALSSGASDAARTCRDLPSRAAQARCLDRLSPGAGSPSAEPRPAPQGVPPAEIIVPGGSGVIPDAPPEATPIK